ncbi:MAG: DUF3370 domain-containing protein [Calothrix sp. C42_A2020_038]|nr:DUF3370 domain-containing protein [Calothrix sp. C42_A2020_038]
MSSRLLIVKPLLIFLFTLTTHSFGCITTSLQTQTPRANATKVAQTPKPAPQEIIQSGEVRALPGKLDTVPVFNSNSPEWIKTEGILLSTFPSTGKKVPTVHLNFPFQGRFDLFAHHYTHTPKDLQTLYIGVILHNPSNKPVTVNVLQAASYLMTEAPFVTLSSYIENNDGKTFSGPGARAVADVLRGIRHKEFSAKLVIPPRSYRMLMNGSISVRGLEKPVNGRSSFMRLQSNGKIYAASMAMFARKNNDGSERAPTLAEWQNLLNTGNFAGPRDKTPTPPDAVGGQLIYGRVAGVSQGSQWLATLSDPNSTLLKIPPQGKTISYGLVTLRGGRLGTEQNQTAKMLVRYPDTAYEAHGNYAIEYKLNLPLHNNTNQTQTVGITLETPFKEDKLSKGNLRFRQPSLDFPFFRGTVRVKYTDDQGKQTTRYVHLWHRTAQVLEPLVKLTIPANTRRQVQVDLIYPPDSTPPHVLTVKTL